MTACGGSKGNRGYGGRNATKSSPGTDGGPGGRGGDGGAGTDGEDAGRGGQIVVRVSESDLYLLTAVPGLEPITAILPSATRGELCMERGLERSWPGRVVVYGGGTGCNPVIPRLFCAGTSSRSTRESNLPSSPCSA